jgi:hypothetical protein
MALLQVQYINERVDHRDSVWMWVCQVQGCWGGAESPGSGGALFMGRHGDPVIFWKVGGSSAAFVHSAPGVLRFPPALPALGPDPLHCIPDLQNCVQ